MPAETMTRAIGSSVSEPRPRLPERIGPFRILGLLGEGGMGRVYEAEQDQPRRVVALKVIKPGVATVQGIHRFERESQVLGRLQHPGIAAIYQAGTADTGDGTQPWFAMELVRGRSLLEYAEEKNLSSRARAELVARVCDAVEHAHQKGVIHRDLKPGNILVDESGQPRVLDFGVARVVDADLQATLRTDVGQLVGTLPYMSPEQVASDPGEIDTRSDVYALGVVLYQLLTGRLPHEIHRGSIPQGVRAIVEDDPTPMSSIDRTLRGDLETIVGRALEKERERRYASAAELASDLRRYLAHEPILAHAPSTLYQVGKFARRNRVLVGGVAAVVLVLAAGLAASLTQLWRATRAERLAGTRLVLAEQRQKEAVSASQREAAQRLLAEENGERATSAAEEAKREAARAEEEGARARLAAIAAREESEKAHAVNGFLQNMLGAANPQAADSMRGRNVTVVQVLDDAGRRLEQGELADQPRVEAEARRTLGATYRELGEYDKAAPHLERALELSAERGLERATSLEDIAWLRQSEGHPDAAEPLFRESLELRRRALPHSDTLVVRSMVNLAAALQDQSKAAPAESLLRAVLALPTGNTRAAALNRSDAQHSLGALLVARKRSAEAEPFLRDALATRRRLLGAGHTKSIQTLESLAKVRIDAGDRVEAERLLRETAEGWERALGDRHPYTAIALSNLGQFLRDQGRLAEAEPLLRRALDVGRAAWGEDDAQVAGMRYNYARLLQSEGKLAAAEPEFARALATMEKTLPADHPSLAAARSGLGSIRTDLGRPAEGEPMLRAALATYRRILPEGSWQIGQVESVLGGNVAAQGRYAEAESLLVEGYDLLKRHAATPPDRRKKAVERLVALYGEWARAAPAAPRADALEHWKAELLLTESNSAR